MKTKIILSLLFTVLLFGCKKDVEPGIDYNVLTEQRILEISEQATITDEDIATLERLLANVTDNSLKPNYTEMIAGVKILKDFIPAFNQLRIDPDVIFQVQYAKLKEEIKLVTDKLPRKAKLQTELETALANYNTEEVEFLAAVLDDEGRGLRKFLQENYNIQPVEGKPTRYLRATIESVDSLLWQLNITVDQEGMLPQALRHFRGLKYLKVTNGTEKVIDLNHLRNLETLILAINDRQPQDWQLKIDQLQNLKHLVIQHNGGKGQSPFGEVIDFTNKYPLLETIELPKLVTNNLTTFLLPDKKHLKKLVIPYGDNLGGAFRKIRRLIIEGNEASIDAGGALSLGKIGTPIEVDEVRLSGLNNSLWLTGTWNEGQVKIKTLNLSHMKGELFIGGNLDIEQLHVSEMAEIESLILNDLRFSQKPDFSIFKLPKAFQIDFQNNTYANGTKFSWEDVRTMFTGKPNPETMKTIYLNGLTNPPAKADMKVLFPNLENYND